MTILERQPGGGENLRVEVAAVVDDDHNRSAGLERRAQVFEHRRDALRVARERRTPAAARRRPQLERAQVFQPEQLVGVAVLLVIVDQSRVVRRGDDAVEGALQLNRARVSVQYGGLARAAAQALELLDSL